MSKIAREEILSRIAGALKHESSRAPGAVSNGSRQAAQRIEHGRELERGELITQFENELRAIGGRFYSASSAGAACEYVQRLIAAGLKRAVAWDCQIIQEMGLAELFEQAGGELVADIDGTSRAEFIRKATEADVCITAVDYALADTGTLVLLTGQGRARAASLLAPVHVALVRCEQVVAGLTDLFALLRAEKGFSSHNMSSAVIFITGPSRTADIELTLVVGVHGPQQLHVILIDE